MDVATLKSKALAIGVELDVDQSEKLIRYVSLLERWNARFNLVSRRDIGRVWPRHVLDSLSVAPLIAQASSGRVQRALDVGTGAGLPGIPLAIADPAVEWLLVDRNQRKIRFLETVVRELGLDNVQARALDLNGDAPRALGGWADLAVSRAVGTPAALVRLAAPLLRPAGCLVLLSGVTREEEPDQHPAPAVELPGFVLKAVREVVIPGLDRTHEVTIIVRDRAGTDPQE